MTILRYCILPVLTHLGNRAGNLPREIGRRRNKVIKVDKVFKVDNVAEIYLNHFIAAGWCLPRNLKTLLLLFRNKYRAALLRLPDIFGIIISFVG